MPPADKAAPFADLRTGDRLVQAEGIMGWTAQFFSRKSMYEFGMSGKNITKLFTCRASPWAYEDSGSTHRAEGQTASGLMIGPKRAGLSTQRRKDLTHFRKATLHASYSTLCPVTGPLLPEFARGWRIETDLVDSTPPAPPEALNKHSARHERRASKDTQTAIGILEFKRSANSRAIELFLPCGRSRVVFRPVAHRFLPKGEEGTVETGVSFLCVEDPTSTLGHSHGTVLVTTVAVLGVVEMHSPGRFVLSRRCFACHNVHYWRDIR